MYHALYGGTMKAMEQLPFVPDMLMIPYQLIADDRLDALDEKVYAVLYWMENVRGGPCSPSNEELAYIVHSKEGTGKRTIQNSLDKLEELGYIVRDYKGTSDRHRIGIRTTISFKMQPEGAIVQKPETPGEFAKKFFDSEEMAYAEIYGWLQEKMPKAPHDLIVREVNKFNAYWSEPNKAGTKMRWQMQKTFEVKRRLATWFGNVKDRAIKNNTPRGATV